MFFSFSFSNARFPVSPTFGIPPYNVSTPPLM